MSWPIVVGQRTRNETFQSGNGQQTWFAEPCPKGHRSVAAGLLFLNQPKSRKHCWCSSLVGCLHEFARRYVLCIYTFLNDQWSNGTNQPHPIWCSCWQCFPTRCWVKQGLLKNNSKGIRETWWFWGQWEYTMPGTLLNHQQKSRAKDPIQCTKSNFHQVLSGASHYPGRARFPTINPWMDATCPTMVAQRSAVVSS